MTTIITRRKEAVKSENCLGQTVDQGQKKMSVNA